MGNTIFTPMCLWYTPDKNCPVVHTFTVHNLSHHYLVKYHKQRTQYVSLKIWTEHLFTKKSKIDVNVTWHGHTVYVAFWISASRVITSIDYSVNPCDNFYDFACGSWMKKHVVPEDRSNLYTYGVVRENVKIIMKCKNSIQCIYQVKCNEIFYVTSQILKSRCFYIVYVFHTSVLIESFNLIRKLFLLLFL